MDYIEQYKEASSLLDNREYAQAAEMFIELREKYAQIAPLCDYCLARISNNTGDPLTAYDLYYRAFSAMPSLTSVLYADAHSSFNYVYEGKKAEKETTACPLCKGADVVPKWCYALSEATGYNSCFNPVRLWMYCEPCHHIYARYFPEKLFLLNDGPRWPNSAFFSYYSGILERISRYAQGMRLFEVGIGACECLLVAQEIGFDAFGIDVIDKHVKMAREQFGLKAETADFVEFETGEKYDIIIMGDVIEHVSDPILAIRKAHDLLSDDGALWVSTPNFDSAFSIVAGHDDAMKRQQYHLNYFSRHSFYALLEKCGFTPVDYCVSSHYNGSMEVIAVKGINN